MEGEDDMANGRKSGKGKRGQDRSMLAELAIDHLPGCDAYRRRCC